MSTSLRNEILTFVQTNFQTTPEYPWAKLPNYAVLRHNDNRKWYGLIADVTKDKLGLHSTETIDILNIKVDPILSGSLREEDGIFPAYHMNKGSWISILLDGTVDKDKIFFLLSISFDLTSAKKKVKKITPHNTDWLIPANPKYYDIEAELANSEDGTTLWKQSNAIFVGDTVYLYLGAPVSAIRYQFKVLEVNLPYEYADNNIKMHTAMKLKLTKEYSPERFPLSVLRDYDVRAIRGARSIPNRLLHKLEET